MISFQAVSLQRGTKFLFDHIDFSLYPNQKVGLVGRNGIGKSSLLSMITGHLSADAGEIERTNGLNIVTVKQEVDRLDLSVIAYVIKGVKALDDLTLAMAEALEQENYTEHARLHGDFEALGGYQIEAKASQLLAGLGFKPSQLHQPVQSLSGGWRIRLNLAQALLQHADLLLLDEPTNHLDLDAVLWLEAYLKNYDGAILLISHDRLFLDNVIEKVLHIENQKVTTYTGHYSSFEAQYYEQQRLQQKAFDKQQAKIAHLEQFITRFKAKASKAKQAQSRVKMLEKIQRISEVQSGGSFSFSFPVGKLPTGALIDLKEADLGYSAGQATIKNTSVMILSEMRVGLLGLNGAGKSTLIKSLVGELPLLSGELKQHPDLRIGYFAQHSLDALDMDATPLLHIQRIDKRATEEKARTFLGRFAFNNEMALTTVKNFSGGEKARLALALIAYQKPNFLLLDEPTNHLDIEVREALTMALQEFQGAAMLVSHDRFLLESSVDDYWLVEDGSVTLFEGDLRDYHQHVTKRQKAQNGSSNTADDTSNPNKRKDQRKLKAGQRRALKPLTDRAKKAEIALEKLQKQLADLDQVLSDENLYLDQSKLNQTLEQHALTKTKFEEMELEWLDALEALEQAQQSIDNDE